MRPAMPLALLHVLAALALAGCAAPDAVHVVADEPSAPRRPAGSATFVEPRMTEAPPADPVIEPVDDPEAPPVTLQDAPSWATAVLVHEAERAHGREPIDRFPCDGTVVAVAAGGTDPRGRIGDFAYVESYQLLDVSGRAWITDRYALDGENVWATNVRGGAVAGSDDGHASCPPEEHEGARYNVLLHARGPDSIETFFLPWGRPAVPEARAWGPVSSSDLGSS